MANSKDTIERPLIRLRKKSTEESITIALTTETPDYYVGIADGSKEKELFEKSEWEQVRNYTWLIYAAIAVVAMLAILTLFLLTR